MLWARLPEARTQVVDVTMELVGAGIMPSGRVGLLDFAELGVSSTPPPFLPLAVITQSEPPRALRTALQLTITLPAVVPTTTKDHRPEWAEGPVNLH